jgi:3-oxoacyl-[acyl-carrier protein] reductase
MDLAIASRDPDREAIARLREYGIRVHRIEADVSVEAQVQRMVSSAVEVFGALDCYVNNAAWAWHEPITKLSTRGLANTMRTNLYACIWACREVAKHMIRRRQGSIAVVGSTAAFTPQATEASYRISKTGLMAYVEVLAGELAPFGIRANMVVPGHFTTRMTTGMSAHHTAMVRAQIPLRRVGEPEEVGNAVALLLSDGLAGYTTGSKIVVDGGLHLRPLPSFSDEELVALNL